MKEELREELNPQQGRGDPYTYRVTIPPPTESQCAEGRFYPLEFAKNKRSHMRYGKEYYEARQMVEGREKECVNCGSRENIEMHHIVPLSQGGSNRPSNIVYLCLECHYKAHGANLGKWKGERKGRPRREKPLGADVLIEQYIRAEITGKEAYKVMGIKRGHTFCKVWFVREYLDNHGIREVRRNQGSSNNQSTTVFYKDGRVEDYRNGELIGSN